MATDLSELVAAVDLPALVESHAGHGRRSGSRWLFQCPNPDHPDRNPSFTVWQTTTGRWRAQCHSQCGWQGDALDLLQWLHGGSKGDAARRLRAWMGRPDTFTPSRKFQTETPAPPQQVRAVDEQPKQQTEAAASAVLDHYLRQRKWPPETAAMFGLTVVLDQWNRPRIRHPFHTWNPITGTWEPTAWQDRASGNSQPKWLTPKGVTLPPFGLRSLDTQPTPTCVVVAEGPADAITATLALRNGPPVAVIGVPGASSWQPGWARWLGDVPVIVAADPDPAGRKLAGVVVNDLGRPAPLVLLTDGDLTDTAQRHGLDAVTALLMASVSQSVNPLAGLFGDDDRTTTTTPQAPEPPPDPVWRTYADAARLGPHNWLWCDTCHQAALVRPGRRCLLTPGCEGHYVTIREGVLAS